MKTRINCPNCFRRLKLKDEHLGAHITCPACKHRFIAKDPHASEDFGLADQDLGQGKADIQDGLLRFNCPKCDRNLKAKEELAGKRMQCPSCRNNISIPKLKKQKNTRTRVVQSKKSAPGKKSARMRRVSAKRKSKLGLILLNGVGVLVLASGLFYLSRYDWDIQAAIDSLSGIDNQTDDIQVKKENDSAVTKEKQSNDEKNIASIKQDKENPSQVKKDKLASEQKKDEVKQPKPKRKQLSDEELARLEEEAKAEAFEKRMEQERALRQEERLSQSEREKRKALEAEMQKQDIQAKNAQDEKSMVQVPKDPFFRDELFNLFKNRCFKCHGLEKSKGDFRMHTREDLLKGGESGDAIVPGKPSKSLLLHLVSLSEDDEEIMPPKGAPLREGEIEKIKKWIADGAKW